jgi:hypothetical protein
MKAALAIVLLLLGIVTAKAQESADHTTITTAGPTINSSTTPGSAGNGNVVAITAGAQITVNGTLIAVTANVIALYYINHTVYQENASLNFFGPVTPGNAGSQVANPVTAVSNLQPDLTAASSGAVTGFPSSKIAYSLTLYPNNVSAQVLDTPTATATALWNTYFGTFAMSHPVVNLETGCSCDNSNGNLTDDQNFMNAWVAYANGHAASGYTITGTQQPLSNNWYSWGSFAENPNGTLTSTSTIKTGQQAYWSQLLYTPTGPSPATTWNPSDQVGMTLTSNNLIATSGASGVFDVRSTGSKTTGKFCWGVVANTISGDFGIGLSNSSYVLGNTGGLGSNGSGYGFFAGKANPNAQIAFLNSALLTSGTAATSVNGEEINECHDFDAQLDWVTDAAMRATYGANAWNNSTTCNPTVASCGISTSGLTCPCFIAYHNRETGVAKLNTNGLFSSGLPSGFTAWDPAVVSTTRPMIVILGRNGEYHVASIH